MYRGRIGVALVVAGLCLAAAPAQADVKTQEKSQVKFEGMLGRMMGLFGGNRAKDGTIQTVAVKGDRKATMGEDSGTIVDLAEEKVYEVNIKGKSYKVVTFAEMRKKMEEARAEAEKAARKDKKEAGGKEMQVDFDVKETGQKKVVNGHSCREVIATIAVHEKGRTLEQSGGILMTVDSWMAPAIPAMKEITDFEMRYARKLGLDISAAGMAQAMAMYPGLKEAMDRFQKEQGTMSGTPVQSVTTFQSVMTPEQASARRDDEKASAPTGGLGGMLGRFGRKKSTEDKAKESGAAADPGKSTIMTATHDLLSVSASATTDDVAVPAGFKQK